MPTASSFHYRPMVSQSSIEDSLNLTRGQLQTEMPWEIDLSCVKKHLDFQIKLSIFSGNSNQCFLVLSKS